MILWHRSAEGEEEERIGQSQDTASDVMKDPANRRFILYGTGVDDILMYKTPAEQTQHPTPDNLGPSTPPTASDIQSFCSDRGEIHQDGTCQSANNSPEPQIHGMSFLAVTLPVRRKLKGAN